MGARRRYAQRQPGTGFRRWFMPLMIVVLFSAGWFAAKKMIDNSIAIANVQIEGSFVHLSQADVQEAIGQTLEGGFFSTDIDQVRTVLLSLPWVQDASIRRQWPSSVKIRVVEKTPVAYWSDDALLSDRGEVFKPEQIDRNMKLPQINGPDGLQYKVWSFLVKLDEQLSDIGIEVKSLALDQRRSWSMVLSNGVELQLGRHDAEKRINRFIKVFAMKNAIDINKIEYVDLRYPNGFAVRNKNESKNTVSLNSKRWIAHA